MMALEMWWVMNPDTGQTKATVRLINQEMN